MAKSESMYVNRELSWLEFNQRVLDEARDTTIPVLERLKFLAITGSNLDEFFMVRVGGLQLLAEQDPGKRDPVGMTPRQTIAGGQPQSSPDGRGPIPLFPGGSGTGLATCRHSSQCRRLNWMKQQRAAVRSLFEATDRRRHDAHGGVARPPLSAAGQSEAGRLRAVAARRRAGGAIRCHSTRSHH